MIYELYGLKENFVDSFGHPHLEEVRDLIATFDSEKLAKEYVKKSELKNPQYHYQSLRLYPTLLWQYWQKSS